MFIVQKVQRTHTPLALSISPTRLLGELAESGGDAIMDCEAEEGEVDERAALVAIARTAFQHHTRRVLAFCVGCLAKPDRGPGGRGEREARRGARLVLTRLAMQSPPRSWRQQHCGVEEVLSDRREGGGECWLSLALKADEGLQQWVAQAAAAAATGGCDLVARAVSLAASHGLSLLLRLLGVCSRRAAQHGIHSSHLGVFQLAVWRPTPCMQECMLSCRW